MTHPPMPAIGPHLHLVLAEANHSQGLPHLLPIAAVVDGADFGTVTLGRTDKQDEFSLREPRPPLLPGASQSEIKHLLAPAPHWGQWHASIQSLYKA